MAKYGNIFQVEAVQYPEHYKYFSSNRIKALVINAMRGQGRLMQRDLESTVENWQHKPTFHYMMRYRNSNPTLYAGTYGSNKANDYWKYVNGGTRFRYTVFLKDYVPMTEVPGSFGTNKPRTLMNPYKYYDRTKQRPGIRARNWTGRLRVMYSESFPAVIQDAITKGLKPK
jgi:hypothetical protein